MASHADHSTGGLAHTTFSENHQFLCLQPESGPLMSFNAPLLMESEEKIEVSRKRKLEGAHLPSLPASITFSIHEPEPPAKRLKPEGPLAERAQDHDFLSAEQLQMLLRQQGIDLDAGTSRLLAMMDAAASSSSSPALGQYSGGAGRWFHEPDPPPRSNNATPVSMPVPMSTFPASLSMSAPLQMQQMPISNLPATALQQQQQQQQAQHLLMLQPIPSSQQVQVPQFQFPTAPTPASFYTTSMNTNNSNNSSSHAVHHLPPFTAPMSSVPVLPPLQYPSHTQSATAVENTQPEQQVQLPQPMEIKATPPARETKERKQPQASLQCTICGKRFQQRGNLRNHIRTHSGDRPFPCAQCGKRFTRKWNLTKHMRTHTGERPFPCTQCEKRFAQKHDLKRHLRVHSGECPYQCRICSKRFNRKGNLQKHMVTHEEEDRAAAVAAAAGTDLASNSSSSASTSASSSNNDNNSSNDSNSLSSSSGQEQQSEQVAAAVLLQTGPVEPALLDMHA